MNTLAQRNCTDASFHQPPRRTLGAALARAYGLWLSRRALARLTPTQLEDVGVTQRQAKKEARRPIWDVPANWRD